MKVLVIENDRNTLRDIRAVLHELNVDAVFASSVSESLAVLGATSPHLVVADIPAGTEGAFVVERLADWCRSRLVFLLTVPSHALLDTIGRCRSALALCRPFHRAQLEATIRIALRQHEHGRGDPAPVASPRERQFERALQEIVAVCQRSGATAPEPPASVVLPASLRPREREVVSLLLSHHRVAAIAGRLGISVHTARNHLKAAFKRLGVHSQQELLDRLRAAAPGRSTASSAIVASPRTSATTPSGSPSGGKDGRTGLEMTNSGHRPGPR